MKTKIMIGAMAGVLAVGLAAPASAQLSANVVATEDNFFWQGGPNNNFGAWVTPQLAIGLNNATQTYRTLLRFNLVSLGEMYEINSAALTLTQASNGKIVPAKGASFDTHLFLLDNSNAAWIEGTGSSAAVVGAACWNSLAYHATTPTARTGGAGIGKSVASAGISQLVDTVSINTSAIAVGDKIVFDLASMKPTLQTWATGGVNAGFFLTTDETSSGQNARLVGSREHTTAAYRPTLTLNYLAMSNAFVKANNALALNDTATWVGSKTRGTAATFDHMIFNNTLSAANSTVDMGGTTPGGDRRTSILRVEDVQGGQMVMKNDGTATFHMKGYSAFVMTNSTEFTKLNGGMHFEAGAQVLVGAGRTLRIADGGLFRGSAALPTNRIVNDGAIINESSTTSILIDRQNEATYVMDIYGSGTMNSSGRIDFNTVARDGATPAVSTINHTNMTMRAGAIDINRAANRMMTYNLVDAFMMATNLIDIGRARTNATDLIVRGSSVVTSAVIRVGATAGIATGINRATITLHDGTVGAGTSLILGNAAFTTGTVVQAGGEVRTASLQFASVNGAEGAYYLYGGTLIAGEIRKTAAGAGPGDGLLVLDGGTLKPTRDNATWIGGANAMDVQLTATGGKIDTDGFAVTINSILANAPSQAGTLTKQGAGTLTLSGNNIYTGNTTVEAGRLAVTGENASGLIVVKNGAELGGSGGVQSVSVESGGILAPGNSLGTIDLYDNLQLHDGAVLRLELSDVDTDSDYINLNGNDIKWAALPGSVTIDLNFTGWHNGTSPSVYTLMGFNISDLAPGDFNVINVKPGLAVSSLSLDSNEMTPTVIPEPASLGALGILAVAALLRRRRR